jgi:hypothetical protein
MKALSASTSVSDPYRAGFTLGEALKELVPEVVFVFSSAEHTEASELLEGLYDGLGRDDVIVIGNSGDGVYEGRRAIDFGAAALALNSGGTVRWCLAQAEGLREAPEGTARAALAALDAQLGGERPAFIYMAADFRVDGTRLERVLHGLDVPIVGGLAGDGYAMTTSSLYANRRVLQDGLVMLAAVGPVTFDILLGQSLVPVGEPGRVDAATGTTIHAIDGLSAMGFIERATGRPALLADRGMLSLAIYEAEHPGRKRLRSIVTSDTPANGGLSLFGGVEPGKMVQVCITGQDQVLHELDALATHSRGLAFEPVAALVVSCAWRKNVLGDRAEREVAGILDAGPQGLAIAGYPSLGECAPLREGAGFTGNLLHNMTSVVLVIGGSP